MIKKGFIIGVLIIHTILLSFPISAENNPGDLDSFSFMEDLTSIIPPPIPDPDDDVPMTTSELLKGAGDEEIFDAVLNLRDINTKAPIQDIHVYVEISSAGEEVKTLQYVSESGLKLLLKSGEYSMVLRVDELDTQGNDYYIKTKIKVSADMQETLYLFPIGSIRGLVSTNQRVVDGALLKFDCSGAYGETEQKSTDSFGSFTSGWLPVGSCSISAAYNGKVGFKEVMIEKGTLSHIEIELTKDTVSSGSKTGVYVILGVFVISIIIFFRKKLGFQKKQQKIKTPKINEKEEKKEEEPVLEQNKRSKDIMKILNDKERSIIDHLTESGNKSSQSNIRHSTGIPKTSLSRMLENLEHKNIITIEKIGKLKKIKLTDWFIGKD